MKSGLTVEYKVHRRRGARCELREGEQPEKPPRADVPAGNVPRVSRLMALAIRFDQLISSGEVDDYADIARLGHVSRARVTQIMNLLNLAPDVQEAILFLPRTEQGRDPVTERDIRPIVAEMDWTTQRRLWKRISLEAMRNGDSLNTQPSVIASSQDPCRSCRHRQPLR